MSKVWVLSQGSYSDYRIIGVCSTQEAAEALEAADSSVYDKTEVEEWELDACVVELEVTVDVYRTADGLFSDWTERVSVAGAPGFQARTQPGGRWVKNVGGEMLAAGDRIRRVRRSERRLRLPAPQRPHRRDPPRRSQRLGQSMVHRTNFPPGKASTSDQPFNRGSTFRAMGRAAGADDRLVARGGLVATASCPGERTLSRIKVSASTSETPLASAMAERRSRSVERMRTTTVEGCLGGAIG